MTQSDVINIVNEIVNTYTGQTIAYQGAYHGQCTCPVAYYVDRLTGESRAPAMANDRADGWGVAFPAQLAPFFTHETYRPGVAYPKGTIMMSNSPHIAIVLSSDGSNTVEVFEQNADPDGSPCHISSRQVSNSYHQCTFVLIPIVQADVPAIPYIMADIPPKEVRINKDTHVWNIDYPTTPLMDANPVTTATIGQVYPMSVLVTHNNGYQYYLEARDNHGGFNVLDCDDYTPPPTPPPPVPITTQGAMALPSMEQKYMVVKTILGFLAYTKALAHEDASTTVAPGSYFIYKQTQGMINLTKTKDIPGYWINPADNVADPLPLTDATIAQAANDPNSVTSWKSTYVSFHDDRSPVKFVFLKDYPIIDADGIRPDIKAKKFSEINIYGTFFKSSIEYYRPKLQADTHFEHYFGVPVVDPVTNTMVIEPYDEVYSNQTSTATRASTKTVTPLDRIVIAGETIGKWWDIMVRKQKKH